MEDDKIIVFLSKNIFNIEDIEDELKNIFNKLFVYYDINVKGYYDIYLYKDNNYGAILECFKDDYVSLEDFIDVKLIIKGNCILYEVEDIPNFNFKYNVYAYNNKFYLEILDNISSKEESIVLENSNIVYKNIDEIKKYAKEVIL